MMAFPLHVKLIGAEDGQRYALPEAGETFTSVRERLNK